MIFTRSRLIGLVSSLFISANSWAFLVVDPSATKEASVSPPSATCKLVSETPGIDEDGKPIIQTGLCSATLIKKDLVLTAAHCVEKIKSTLATAITVTCPNEKETYFGIVTATPFEYKNEASKDYAFVRISSKVKSTQPMKVLTQSDDLSNALKGDCFAAGYGRDKDGKSSKLLAAKMFDLNYYAVENQWIIASVGTKSWVDHGDSGGSLYCKLQDGSTALVGVTSMKSERTLINIFSGETKKQHLSVFAPTSNLSWTLDRIDQAFERNEQLLRSEVENILYRFKTSQSRTLESVKVAKQKKSSSLEIMVDKATKASLSAPPFLSMLKLPQSAKDYKISKKPIADVWRLGRDAQIALGFSAQIDQYLNKK